MFLGTPFSCIKLFDKSKFEIQIKIREEIPLRVALLHAPLVPAPAVFPLPHALPCFASLRRRLLSPAVPASLCRRPRVSLPTPAFSPPARRPRPLPPARRALFLSNRRTILQNGCDFLRTWAVIARKNTKEGRALALPSPAALCRGFCDSMTSLLCVLSRAKDQRDAPNSSQRHHCVDDSAQDRVLPAEQPRHKIELEKSNASPV